MATHRVGKAHVADEVLAKYKQEFDEAINDDINVPLALGVLWTLLKEPKSNDVYKLVLEMDKMLGLSLDKAQLAPVVEEKVEAPEDVIALCEKRLEAKRAKDYATADALRAEIAAKGFEVIDSKDGYSLKLAK